jgi:hypothetical protein
MMSFFSAIGKLLQYAPLVMEVTRAMGGPNGQTAPETPHAEFESYKSSTDKRIDALSREVTQLRDRLRRAEEALVNALLWLRIGVPVLAILAIVILIILLSD